MKLLKNQVFVSLCLAVLQLTGCYGLKQVKKAFASGEYIIKTATLKDGQTLVTLEGIKGAFLLPGDTLKPGKKIWITYMQKAEQ